MLANHVKNIKDCATDFIEDVNNKNAKQIKNALEISEMLFRAELQNKNTEVVQRIMSIGSKMFVDAIALYLIENKLEIREVKEDGTK